LSRKAKKVYGVEVVEEAVVDAKENARLNGANNAEFILGEAEIVIPKLYKRGIKADVIIVDPPRKGCDIKLLEVIAKMAPNKIIYVSCNPSTLARDLKYLVSEGYSVKGVQPVDLFAQTVHIECVIGMQRKDT
ncbi:MAG: RsmD family RNA methyltransferase, partial [Firmicutes bacterium]|nr:RsmD family RNA methyltransferase [Bacillota bacterium]